MNKILNNKWILLGILFIFLLSGCQAIGSIFKAGMWVGVVGIIILVILIFWIISKFSKKG